MHFGHKVFCLITTGGVITDVIKRYIETQGCKNEKEYGSKNKNIS